MRRLPRRLALWGGAAAIAGGGFAFMASNSVFQSSAGQGGTKISGYTVSKISYTVTNVDYVNGNGSPYSAITGVSFHLMAKSTTNAAETKPKDVNAWILNNTGNLQWGHVAGCSVTSWVTPNPTIGLTRATAPTTTVGSGTVHCTTGTKIPTATAGTLVVEANQ